MLQDMNRLIIQGSSRSQGHTSHIINVFKKEMPFDVLDLNEMHIAPFDYEFNNTNDDFLPAIKNIANNYDLLLFATPVYWYSMSGIMKNFFDRISDCLKIEKETGRKLKGKKMAIVSVGSDDQEIPGFYVPFQKSAKYLEMQYLGHLHTWMEGACMDARVEKQIQEFIQILK